MPLSRIRISTRSPRFFVEAVRVGRSRRHSIPCCVRSLHRNRLNKIEQSPRDVLREDVDFTSRWIKRLFARDRGPSAPARAPCQARERHSSTSALISTGRCSPEPSRECCSVLPGIRVLPCWIDFVEIASQRIHQFSNFAVSLSTEPVCPPSFLQLIDQFAGESPREIIDEIERVLNFVSDTGCQWRSEASFCVCTKRSCLCANLLETSPIHGYAPAPRRIVARLQLRSRLDRQKPEHAESAFRKRSSISTQSPRLGCLRAARVTAAILHKSPLWRGLGLARHRRDQFPHLVSPQPRDALSHGLPPCTR